MNLHPFPVYSHNYLNVQVFGQEEETKEPKGNWLGHSKNMQTPRQKVPAHEEREIKTHNLPAAAPP